MEPNSSRLTGLQNNVQKSLSPILNSGWPRILYVSTVSNSLWGFLGPLAAHFRSLGWRVDGMARGATDCQRCRPAFDHLWEAPWSRNPFDARNMLVAPNLIREIVDAERYHIVHVHTPVAAFVTRFALRRHAPATPAVIYTAHGFHFHPLGDPVRNTIFRSLEKIAGRWTDHLVVINQTDYRAALSAHIAPSSKVWHIAGIGIDTTAYSSANVSERDVARVREEMGAGATEQVLLMLAEFNPGKRHHDALHAFAAAKRPGVHLALAGVGPTLEPMRALASKLGIANQVHFLGMRHDVPALIRASAAVLLPSEREGLSRSVMEALSLEVPVLGSRIRGIEDLVGDDAGVLFQPGDIPAFSRAIGWILDHPEEARRMGHRGRERMKFFELERVRQAHRKLYNLAMEKACDPIES